MLTVTIRGSDVHVAFPAQAVQAETEGGEALDQGPNPIMPEVKELAWGAGSFILLLIAMRIIIPKMRKGMEQRYGKIQGQRHDAEAAKAAAEAELAEYQAAVAGVRAEGAKRVDAARQQLESERQARLAEVNAEIAEQRRQATEEADAARAAVQSQIQAAVGEVVRDATARAIGREPSAAVLDRAVSDVMSAGVGR